MERVDQDTVVRDLVELATSLIHEAHVRCNSLPAGGDLGDAERSLRHATQVLRSASHVRSMPQQQTKPQ